MSAAPRLLLAGLLALQACDSRAPDQAPAEGGAAGGGGRAGDGGRAGGGLTGRSRTPHIEVGGLPSVQSQPSQTVQLPADGPDCGPGCRLVLARPIEHDSWGGHAFSDKIVADTNPNELLFAAVGSTETTVIAEAPAQADVADERIAFLSVPYFPAGDIVVLDTRSMQRTTYFHFDDAEVVGDSLGLVLGDKYVFWMTTHGTWRANLESGEVTSQFAPSLLCDGSCVMGGDLLCLDGRIRLIDQETGEQRALDNGGALQLDAGCSPDRGRVAWIDFRDPPGRSSTFSGQRIGGEVYLYDSATQSVTRLTHDSPASPITKAYAAVGTDLVVWIEPCAACPKSFSDQGVFFDTPFALVRLELASNRKCRLEGRNIGDYSSLHGHDLYAYWTDGSNEYLVVLDLDNPELDWVCE